MKKLITLLLVVPVLVLAMIVATGCTKEGEQGPKGEDGVDGEDGTATCGQCHNDDENLVAKVIQWEESIHATGGHFHRNSSSCAPCHTSQGFRLTLDGTELTEDVSDPNPINCYTCHKIHDTYEAADWELRYTDPVALLQGGTVADNGTSNLCGKCHQSRATEPYPEMGAGNIDLTEVSKRWGPHHGPQSNLFTGLGTGAYEVGTGYENSWHSNNFENGCIPCHMSTVMGPNEAGGHTFGVAYDGELNTSGCLVSGCHSNEDNLIASVEEKQAEIEGLLENLHNMLIAQGVTDSSGYLVSGTYTNAQAGAHYNFKFIEEDRSMGIHNYKYSKTLLTNSIAAIQ